MSPQLRYRREGVKLLSQYSSDFVPTVKVLDSVGNQLIIPVWHGSVFQSYGSNVAYMREGRMHLYNPYWNMYSQTTNKYLLRFLGEYSIVDVRKKVESGEYIEMGSDSIGTN